MNGMLNTANIATIAGDCLLNHDDRCGCSGASLYLVTHKSWVMALPACVDIATSYRGRDGWDVVSFDALAFALNYGDQRPLPQWARDWAMQNLC